METNREDRIMGLVGDKIYPILYAASENMRERPYKDFQDMKIGYVLRDGPGMVEITDKMLKHWDMSEEKLHELAIRNLKRDKPLVIPLTDRELNGNTRGPMPCILSNEREIYGASMLLNTDFLDQIYPGMHYYVMPVSVHDAVLIPDDGRDLEAFSRMITDIDEVHLDRDEKLSGSVFGYDRKSHGFTKIDPAGIRKEVEIREIGTPAMDLDLEIGSIA